MNEKELKLIKEYEGLRLNAYPDPGSKNGLPWTIGYGHTGGLSAPIVKKGDVITEAQALKYLENDLKAVDAIINKYVKVSLNENQRGALRSFIYNIGEGQFAKSSVLKFINQNKLDSVPGRMALYRLNDGKVMAGLVRRRTAEGALWMTPVGSKPDNTIEGNTPAKPDNPKKPWDWGAVGALVTLLAGLSDNVKKLIGNITNTFGVDPITLLIIAGVVFAIYTFYNKWKDN